MPHTKKHPEYNKRKTRRVKLRKDDYEHGADKARKIIDSGKKDKKIIFSIFLSLIIKSYPGIFIMLSCFNHLRYIFLVRYVNL
jgi:hypothetical protein